MFQLKGSDVYVTLDSLFPRIKYLRQLETLTGTSKNPSARALEKRITNCGKLLEHMYIYTYIYSVSA